MKRGVRHFLLIGMIACQAMSLPACAQTSMVSEPAAEHAPAQPQARVPNEYLVTLVPDANESIISQYYGRYGIKYLHLLEEDTFLLVVSDDPGPQEMAAQISKESRIKVVQPNLIQWDYR